MSAPEDSQARLAEGRSVSQSDASQSTKTLPKASRRRDKPQLSCNLCRRRKLKCDRRQPCETCARRGLSLSCTYVNPHGVEQPNQEEPHRPASTNIPDRIAQLENLVVSLMKNVNGGKSVDPTLLQGPALPKGLPSPPEQGSNDNMCQADSSQLSNSFGRIKLTNDETSYVESAHWTAILDGIAELKDYFGDDHDSPNLDEMESDIPPYQGPALLFGAIKPATRQEILAAVPPKHIADSLLAKYFKTMGLAPVVIHGPTFLKEYERFWANPQDTSIMWIGLLFATLCTAYAYQQLTSNTYVPISQLRSRSRDNEPVITFREKMIQCLVLGKYSKGGPYTLEVLVFYMFIEMFQSDDTEIEVWLLMGVITRLALKMGYHRDPSHSPLISPFHGEMRRRAWHAILQMDIVTSAQMGLPSMIRDVQTDTRLPHNLFDEDFDESTVELPPSRPESDITPSLFLVSKNKLVKIFGLIHEMTTSVQSPPYSEVLRLDKLLRDTFKALPQQLHMQPLSKSIRDNVDILLGRIYVALLYYKSLVFLHRSYIFLSKTNSSYIYSHDACLEASLTILKYQSILDVEMQTTGRLYQERWKISSLVRQEFLIATTILCLYLDRDLKEDGSRELRGTMPDLEMRNRIVKELYGSYLIWLRSTETSKEAQRAAQVLRIVLSKAPKVSTPPAETDITFNNASSSNEQTSSRDLETLMAGMSPVRESMSFENAFLPADSLDNAWPMPIDASNSFTLINEFDLPDFTMDPYLENWQPIYQI